MAAGANNFPPISLLDAHRRRFSSFSSFMAAENYIHGCLKAGIIWRKLTKRDGQCAMMNWIGRSQSARAGFVCFLCFWLSLLNIVPSFTSYLCHFSVFRAQQLVACNRCRDHHSRPTPERRNFLGIGSSSSSLSLCVCLCVEMFPFSILNSPWAASN